MLAPSGTRSGSTPARSLRREELENLQHEIASLAKRQADLEEVELEVLERLEDVQTELVALRERAGPGWTESSLREQAKRDAQCERDRRGGG